ncbi:hypothetical protein BaRGS_00032255, partial [Batillaria attramentaria]
MTSPGFQFGVASGHFRHGRKSLAPPSGRSSRLRAESETTGGTWGPICPALYRSGTVPCYGERRIRASELPGRIRSAVGPTLTRRVSSGKHRHRPARRVPSQTNQTSIVRQAPPHTNQTSIVRPAPSHTNQTNIVRQAPSHTNQTSIVRQAPSHTNQTSIVRQVLVTHQPDEYRQASTVTHQPDESRHTGCDLLYQFVISTQTDCKPLRHHSPTSVK